MRKLLFVFLIGALLLPAGCNLAMPSQKYEAVLTENGELQARVQQLESQTGQLEADKAALEEKLAEKREDEPTDPFDEKILGSLFLRPDLIPVGGESMRYYTDLCRVLGEQIVYAYAEDGRNTADMILSYALREDGSYEWTLEAYDDGHGWRAPQQGGGMDATGTVPAPVESAEAAVPEKVDREASSSRDGGSATSQDERAPSAPQSSASSSSSPSAPGLGVPVPNEAQQQKFREIASLIE